MKNNIFSKVLYAGIALAFSATAAHAQGTITTVAGGGTSSGEGVTALSATFMNPTGVATDVAGNIFITDKDNHKVRMLSASTGLVTTVAGTGTFGYSGMGGPAVSASIIYPNAIVADNAGNIYFTDWFADAALKVDATTHRIANICGHDSQGCGGDGGDGPSATMCIPNGIARDNAGNIYMIDYGSNRIRRLDAVTNIVTSVNNGTHGVPVNGVPALTAAYGQIAGVCVDNVGNIYVADAGNHVVRRIDHTTGLIRTIVGNGTAGYSGDGGPALSAKLRSPGYMYINAAGNLFICDNTSNVVRVVNIATNMIETLAGTGTMGFSGDGGSALAATLSGPTGVWQNEGTGDIYIADAGNRRIRMVSGSAYKTTGTNGLSQNTVSIFPNPSSGTFTVQTAAQPDNGSIEVYNVAGEKVFSANIDQQQTTVNLNQPSGIYSVILKTATSKTIQKVTISK